MPTYNFIHPDTKAKISVTGDTPPDEATLDQIFSETANAVSTDSLRGMVASHAQRKNTSTGPSYDDFKTEFIKSQAADDYKIKSANADAFSGMKNMARKALPYARPTLEGLGAIVGGGLGGGGGLLAGAPTVVGAPAAAVTGGLAGAGLGYSTVKTGLDYLEEKLGGSPEAERLANRSMAERMLAPVHDAAMGTTYEMGGQVLAPFVGKAIRAVKAAPKVVVHPIESANKAWNYGTKRAAAKRISDAVSKEQPVVELAAKNKARYQELQSEIDGLNLPPAAVSDDASQIKMHQNLLHNADGASDMNQASKMKTYNSTMSYLDQAMPQGSLDDFLKAIEAQGAARTNNVSTQASQMSAMDKEAASAQMRQLELGAQRRLKGQADELYAQVPKETHIDSSPLYNKLNELGEMVDPAFADPRNMPSGMINRAKNALNPEDAADAAQFDYKSIYNQLTNNQAYSRGKSGTNYWTDSDFSRQLSEFFPSVKGYPKNEILGALRDAMNGKNIGAFKQGILDDMAYDLAGRGANASTKSQQAAFDAFIPPDPNAVSYGQLMQYNEQVTKALRQAKATGNFAQANNLSEIKSGIQRTLKLAEETGQGEGVQALRKANSFYRDTYVPAVRQGQTAKNLATTRTGEFRVADEISAGKYLQEGDSGLAAANDFNRLFGQDPNAKKALQGYAQRDLFDAATANGTQAPSLKAAEAWIAKRTPALKKLGMENEFSGFKDALKQEADLADFKAVLGQDPQTVLKSLLSARGDKDIVRSALDLKTLVQGNTGALNGLKRSISDLMMAEAQISKKVGGTPVITDAKMQTFWQKYEPAMKLIYSADEMKALKNVREVFEIQNRAAKQVVGLDGSVSQSHKKVEEAFAKALPVLSYAGRAARGILGYLAKEKATSIDAFALKAQFDPVFAKELADLGKIGMKNGEKAMNKAVAEWVSRYGAYATASEISKSYRPNSEPDTQY